VTIFLIIVSLYGGIERVPMSSDAACKTAADQFNTASRVATAFCIKNAP
jgi:hypothetical protein